MRAPQHSRYSVVAIVLHWLIALAVIAMIPLGWWMTDNVSDPAKTASVFKAFQLHKSIGLSVLVLTLLRLAWRAIHRPPALPATMAPWERTAARIAHGLLYLLMLGLPLTGWVYVSTGWNVQMNVPFPLPTLWFGLFDWPHLPGLATLADTARGSVARTAITVHAVLAWGAVILIVLHVGAALKHHLIDRDDVLARMLPLLRRTKEID